jgi:hypothetical protein
MVGSSRATVTAAKDEDGLDGAPSLSEPSETSEPFPIMRRVVPRDAIPSIDDPEFNDVIGADLEYHPHEMVLGVEVGGDARAYPIGLLAQHEIVNDTVGGQPIAVTYCPLCFTGIVYSREIGAQEYTFGVSGRLLRNVLVMYDRQTESLWSQLLGEAVWGDLKGTQLEFFPSWLTTWEEWKSRYPGTLALVKGYKVEYDPYYLYYETERAGAFGEGHRDPRVGTKQFVVGVALGDEAVAYPWGELSLEPVVNDVVGGTPVLVVFGENTATGVVFDRGLEGQLLTFSMSDPETLTLTDAQTGSTWEGLTGLATDGPLSGKQLARVKSTSSFWFGWKDWYPETRVHGEAE